MLKLAMLGMWHTHADGIVRRVVEHPDEFTLVGFHDADPDVVAGRTKTWGPKVPGFRVFDTPEALLHQPLDGVVVEGRVHDNLRLARLAQESGEPSGAGGADRLARGMRTPESVFVLPILRALQDLGGSAPMQQVIEKVGAAMKDKLRDVDHQPLKSDPGRPRWNNTVQWARNTMVADGLLKNNSPRGVWEISAAGAEHLRRVGEAG